MLGLLDRVRAPGHWLGLALLAGITVTQLRATPDMSLPNVGDDEVATIDVCSLKTGHHGAAGPQVLYERFIEIRAHADWEYRHGRFADAAALARSAASLASYHGGTFADQSIDFANLASQYAELDRTYALAFDPAASAIDALPAVREAWKLDIVLGGAHADELQERLALVAPQAALDFFARDQLDEAEQALAMVELLGIDDARMHKLGIAIAKRRR